MSNVIDNLGRIKVALSGAGSWPFSQIWTVSQAEPLADFSTIANAIAGVGTGDGILLDAENFNETLTINVFIYLLGLAPDLSTINGKITSSQASNLENLKVEVTSAEAIEITSLVFSYNYIKNCTFNATTGSGLKAIWDKIGYNFYNCNANASGGSGNQYGYYFQPGSALTSNIYGGIYRGTTADIYADTNATINLFGPVLYNSTIAGPGTVNGWFYDTSGGLHRVGSGGTSQYVKQATANGALSVGTIAAADLPAATESAQGAAELATQAETDAGTDNTRIVTPLKLKTTPIDYFKVSKIYESDAGAVAFSADATGYLSAAVQPLFSAYISADVTNVTGDGTVYQVVFDTEIFDRNSNYNNSTGVFTAPVTGKFLFLSFVRVTGLTSAHTLGSIRLVTSNRTYAPFFFNPFAVSASANATMFCQAIADMDSSDTAYIDISVFNGTKVADAGGSGAQVISVFCGYLLP